MLVDGLNHPGRARYSATGCASACATRACTSRSCATRAGRSSRCAGARARTRATPATRACRCSSARGTSRAATRPRTARRPRAATARAEDQPPVVEPVVVPVLEPLPEPLLVPLPEEDEDEDDEPEPVEPELVEPLAAGSVGGSSTMKPRWLVWSPVRLKLNVFAAVIELTSGASGESVTLLTLGTRGLSEAVSGRSSSWATSPSRKNSAWLGVLPLAGGMKTTTWWTSPR